MAAGPKRERVSVYASTPTVNSDGERMESAVLLFSPWVEIKPVRGSEEFKAKQVQAGVTHLVRMWSDSYSRTITPRHWLIRSDGSTRLNVVRVVDPKQRRQELELECIEQVTGM
jgi:SPP1 family predicted phage head-tail adaptor